MENDEGLARRSATISILTAVAVASGLAVDVLLVARFGVGSQTDAFFVGYTVPLLLVTCAAALQPVLVTILAGPAEAAGCQANPAEAANYRASGSGQLTTGALPAALLNAATLLALGLAAAGVLAARPLVAITAPGLDPATAATAARLAGLLFWRVPASAAAEVLKAELYVRHRFGLATLSNAIPSLVTAVLLLPGIGRGIDIAALGLVGGAVLQAGLLAAVLFGPSRAPYRLVLLAELPALRRTGRLAMAPLVALILRQGVTLAERILGSFLPAGGVTALSYASRLTMVAAGILFDGLNTASLPSLASCWASGAMDAFRAGLSRLLRHSIVVAVPLGLAVAACSLPLVRLFFERGQVDRQAALQLGAVLGVYALSLPFLGPYRAVQTFFYAIQRPGPVVALHGGLTAVTVALALVLVGPLGAQGLALAQVAGCAVATAAGLAWLARRVGRKCPGMNWQRLGDLAWRLVLATVPAAAIAAWTSHRLDTALNDLGASAPAWAPMAVLSASALAGMAVFALLGAVLRLGIVTGAWAALTGRRRRPPGLDSASGQKQPDAEWIGREGAE